MPYSMVYYEGFSRPFGAPETTGPQILIGTSALCKRMHEQHTDPRGRAHQLYCGHTKYEVPTRT